MVEDETRRKIDELHAYCQAKGHHFFAACYDGKAEHFAANGNPHILSALIGKIIGLFEDNVKK